MAKRISIGRARTAMSEFEVKLVKQLAMKVYDLEKVLEIDLKMRRKIKERCSERRFVDK